MTTEIPNSQHPKTTSQSQIETPVKCMKTLAFCRKNGLVQLNKYETDPNFLQFFQSSTKVRLIIHVFCKSCEPEVVFVLICTLAEQFQVHNSYKTRESTLS